MRIGVEERSNPANHNYSSGNMTKGRWRTFERDRSVFFPFGAVRTDIEKTLNTDQSDVSVSVTVQKLFGNTESSREIPLTNMRKNHYHEKSRDREKESNAESGEFFFLRRSIIIIHLTQ